MKQQVMVNNKYVQKPDQLYRPVMVGSEAKNPLPTNMSGIDVMDLIGLSWIFAYDKEGKIDGIQL